MMPWKKLLPSTAHCFSNCNETNFLVSQTFHHLMKQSTALSAFSLSSVVSR
jgi:hypothetical protein